METYSTSQVVIGYADHDLEIPKQEADKTTQIDLFGPTLRHAEPHLGIQVGIVVPGEPVGGVQLPVRQPHHLGEAGVDPIDFVDHPLRGNQRLPIGFGGKARSLPTTIRKAGTTVRSGSVGKMGSGGRKMLLCPAPAAM